MSDDASIPGSFSIIDSRTQSRGSYSFYYYQLNNVDGQPLTGQGYYAAEYVSPADVGQNSNGVYVPLNNGVAKDMVGFLQQPAGPVNGVFTQTFSVLYQGYFYPLSTVFQHQDIYTTSYSNGFFRYNFYNTVTVVHP